MPEQGIITEQNAAWKPKMNLLYGLCKQVISVRRKAFPSPLFVHANGGHRFPGCGQAGEPPGDEGGVKFVTEQIWPLVSGHHLNPYLIANVKYTLSPFLSFLNKWPPDTERGMRDVYIPALVGCTCMLVCVIWLSFS